MRFSEFSEIRDPKTQDKIRSHYAQEIRELNQLGFLEELYIREEVFPFSAILLFPMTLYLMTRSNLTQMGGFLQASSMNYVLIHEEGYATGNRDKNNDTLYSAQFDDGTILITTTAASAIKSEPQYGLFYHICKTKDPAEAWKQHVASVAKLSKMSPANRHVVAPLSISDVFWMSYRVYWIWFGGTPYEDEKSKKKNQDQ